MKTLALQRLYLIIDYAIQLTLLQLLLSSPFFSFLYLGPLGLTLFFSIIYWSIIGLCRSPAISLRIPWTILALAAVYLAVSFLIPVLGSLLFPVASLGLVLQVQSGFLAVLPALPIVLLTSAFPKIRRFAAGLQMFLAFLILTSPITAEFPTAAPLLYRLLWILLPGACFVSFLLNRPTPPPGTNLDSSGTDKPPALLKRILRSYLPAGILLLLIVFFWSTEYRKLLNFPEPDTKNSGLLQKNPENLFDFTEQLQFSETMKMENKLLMIVQKDASRYKSGLYLKRYELSGLNPKYHFFLDRKQPAMPGEPPVPARLVQPRLEFPDPGYQARTGQTISLFYSNLEPTVLLTQNYPLAVQLIENWEDSSFRRIYRTESKITTEISPTAYRIGDYETELPADLLDYYTRLDESYRDIREFARELIRELYGPAPVRSLYALEAAGRVIRYFHQNYYYSLQPGDSPDGDRLRRFLYQNRRGYCTYFTTAAGLILRALGLPTRAAVGFLIDPKRRTLDYYPVLSSQAHSWLEVYNPKQGWIIFDPTTFQTAPGEEPYSPSLPRDLPALMEELLKNPILNEEKTAPLFSGLRDRFPPISVPSPDFFLVFLLYLYVIGSLFYYDLLRYRAFFLVPDSPKQKDYAVRAGKLYLALYLRDRKPAQSLREFAEQKQIPDLLSYIDLLQKYYFSPAAGPEDIARLRKTLARAVQSLREPRRMTSAAAHLSRFWHFELLPSLFPWTVLRANRFSSVHWGQSACRKKTKE